jgi:endonuclease/exonuclease/phosphatase family metal-dependent hydrolase
MEMVTLRSRPLAPPWPAVKALRILSYNVRYFGHATRGLASTRTSMRGIARAIAGLQPLADIVCLQEVEDRSLRSHVAHRGRETQLERFAGMLSGALADCRLPDSYQAHYFPAHSYRLSPRTPVYTTGLAVLAHRDLEVDQHNARTPYDITDRNLHPLRRFKQTRICAHVRLRRRDGKGHGPIDVFNTHLSLPSTLSRAFWTEPKRLGWGPNQVAEARNLARFVEAQRKSDRFVVVGDFNALPGSPVHRFLVREHGWVDAFARRYAMSDAELEKWPTAGFMRMRMNLDHVFAGGALDWLDFEGTHAFGDRTAPFHGLSDHVPLVGRCKMTNTL